MTDEGCTSFLDDFLGQSQHFSDKRIQCEVKREPCRQGKRNRSLNLVVVWPEIAVTVGLFALSGVYPK